MAASKVTGAQCQMMKLQGGDRKFARPTRLVFREYSFRRMMCPEQLIDNNFWVP